MRGNRPEFSPRHAAASMLGVDQPGVIARRNSIVDSRDGSSGAVRSVGDTNLAWTVEKSAVSLHTTTTIVALAATLASKSQLKQLTHDSRPTFEISRAIPLLDIGHTTSWKQESQIVNSGRDDGFLPMSMI